jgi:hypothetical protein
MDAPAEVNPCTAVWWLQAGVMLVGTLAGGYLAR